MGLHAGQHSRIVVSCLDEGTAKAIADRLARTDDVEVQWLPSDVRAVEVTVLVAFVSAGSAAATAVLTGVFSVLTQRGGRTVRIRGASGREIEVPADTPPDRLEEYLAIAQRLDAVSIEVR